MELLLYLGVLIISVILHEVAHGYMAYWLGDPTAKLQGRLTLNPFVHIDPVGSVLLPGLLLFWQSVASFSFPFLVGYAKPVPYNPYSLKGKYAEGLVAFAGPGTNILLALIFGLLIRFFGMELETPMLMAFGTIAYVNMLLALFNLIPIPPLDGSKVLSSLLLAVSAGLAHAYENFRRNFESLGMLPMIIILMVIFSFMRPAFQTLLKGLFGLLTGVSA